MCRIQSFIHWDTKSWHLFFVEFDICNLLTVGRPLESPVKFKLLFVYPVGNTVDDFIEFTVGSHLALGIKPEAFYKKIIVSDKSNLFAIRGEGSNLLTTRR